MKKLLSILKRKPKPISAKTTAELIHENQYRELYSQYPIQHTPTLQQENQTKDIDEQHKSVRYTFEERKVCVSTIHSIAWLEGIVQRIYFSIHQYSSGKTEAKEQKHEHNKIKVIHMMQSVVNKTNHFTFSSPSKYGIYYSIINCPFVLWLFNCGTINYTFNEDGVIDNKATIFQIVM